MKKNKKHTITPVLLRLCMSKNVNSLPQADVSLYLLPLRKQPLEQAQTDGKERESLVV